MELLVWMGTVQTWGCDWDFSSGGAQNQPMTGERKERTASKTSTLWELGNWSAGFPTQQVFFKKTCEKEQDQVFHTKMSTAFSRWQLQLNYLHLQIFHRHLHLHPRHLVRSHQGRQCAPDSRAPLPVVRDPWRASRRLGDLNEQVTGRNGWVPEIYKTHLYMGVSINGDTSQWMV